MTKILVIEDAQPLRKDIVEMLMFEGFDVVGAENGLVGVQCALEVNPDLIICDIMMPVLDGYETTRQIRLQPKFKDLPILALTAKAMKEDREKCLAAGANDYLSKPVDIDRLFSMLHVWLYQ